MVTDFTAAEAAVEEHLSSMVIKADIGNNALNSKKCRRQYFHFLLFFFPNLMQVKEYFVLCLEFNSFRSSDTLNSF